MELEDDVVAAVEPMWRTVALDLADVPAELDVADLERVDAWLFDRDLPVAREWIPVPHAVLPGSHVLDRLGPQASHRLVRRRLLDALRPSAPRSQAGPTDATVLLCTRDRPEDLRRCLDALAALEPGVAEVVVVDNGTRPQDTRAVVEAAGARYVRQERKGLSRARNAGLDAVQTELVLLTDDDVAVHPRWAAELTEPFRDPLVAATAGLVLPATLEHRAQQLFELHNGFSRGLDRRVLDGTYTSPWRAGGAGATASMAMRTHELRTIGGFAPHLDAGTPTGSGGDTFAVHCLLLAGHRVVYTPTALAFHTHRATEEALFTVFRAYGTGMASYLITAAAAEGRVGSALAGTKVMATWIGRRLAGAVLRRSDAVPLPLALAEARGALAAPRALRAARRDVLASDHPAPAVADGGEPPWRQRLLARRRTAPTAVTEELPSISVVVPTRGRRDRVVELVRRLQTQRYPDRMVELVVACDGDVDGSPAALESLDVPRRARVVRLPHPGGDPEAGNGAGAARNAGIEAATGQVMVFLDDDVEPVDDQLLLTHGHEHGRSGRPRPVLAVGLCPPRFADESGYLAQGARGWWSDATLALLDGDALRFTDVTTGNCSVPREVLLAHGGFQPIPRREDYELGYRLQAAGVELVAAPAAAVVHATAVDVRAYLADCRREGAGDALLCERHPGAFGALPVELWRGASPRQRRALRAIMAGRAAAPLVPALGSETLAALERAGLRGRWAHVLRRCVAAAYWAGVGDAVGSGGRWEAIVSAAEAAGGRSTAHYDLRTGELRLPGPGEPCDVWVTAGGERLGRAPLRWGGIPFRQERFVDQILWRWGRRAVAEEALHGRGRSAPVAEPAGSGAAAGATPRIG